MASRIKTGKKRQPRTLKTPSEHYEQATLFKWAALEEATHPELCLMFAIPNGGARSAVTGARLKEEGVKTGVPDIFLPVPRGPFCGLFIEMKRRLGGYTAPEQTQWLANLCLQGYQGLVCRGFEAARLAIKSYLLLGEPEQRGGAEE